MAHNNMSNQDIQLSLPEETIARLTLLAESFKTTDKAVAAARAIEIAALVVNAMKNGKTVTISDGFVSHVLVIQELE